MSQFPTQPHSPNTMDLCKTYVPNTHSTDGSVIKCTSVNTAVWFPRDRYTRTFTGLQEFEWRVKLDVLIMNECAVCVSTRNYKVPS